MSIIPKKNERNRLLDITAKSRIPDDVKLTLWGQTGGRCAFCNKPLWFDPFTKQTKRHAHIAHIIADRKGGARYSPELSVKLSKDIINLMLMCPEHHEIIDAHANLELFTVEYLTNMKNKHEASVAYHLSLMDKPKSHILLFSAKIGDAFHNINRTDAARAIFHSHIPAEQTPIEISCRNSSFQDHEDAYWSHEIEDLRRKFKRDVRQRLSEDIQHLSIFAIAPQPLLIELGRIVSDKVPASVYQLHKTPTTWAWQDGPEDFEYKIHKPPHLYPTVALNLSLSGSIDAGQIISVLGDDTSIWTFTIDSPYVDFVRNEKQVYQFQKELRLLYNEIKLAYGQDTVLNIFPACPASLAFEIGRVWNGKADMPLSIYDQNRQKNGFYHVCDITYDASPST